MKKGFSDVLSISSGCVCAPSCFNNVCDHRLPQCRMLFSSSLNLWDVEWRDSVCSAIPKGGRVSGHSHLMIWWLVPTRRPSSSHVFIGVLVGQNRRPLWRRSGPKTVSLDELCRGLALSCWRITPWPWFCIKGRSLFLRMFTYPTASRLPWTMTESVRWLSIIPAQTMMLSRSCTQHWANLTFWRLWTLTLPSAKLTLKPDSSVKITFRHWALVQCLWWWAQAKQAALWCALIICPP